MPIADITIITASYNSKKFLEETVNSVANQTVLPKKHFIIDDCSTDNSLQLAQRLAARHPYVEVIPHETNKGFPGALNTGISHADTKYIAILDSDDVAYDNWIELTTQFLDSNPDFGLVGGGGNIMTEGGTVTDFFKYCENKGDVTHFAKQGNYPLLHPGTVFRKALLADFGGYREDLKSSEDNDLFINFAHVSKLYNLGQPLIYYRRLRASESRVSDEYRNLIDQYILEKVRLLESGLTIQQTNDTLAPIVTTMTHTPRLSKLAKGQYEHDMGASLFLGKKHYRALLFLLAAYVAGNGKDNLKWAFSIIKNKLLMRY